MAATLHSAHSTSRLNASPTDAHISVMTIFRWTRASQL